VVTAKKNRITTSGFHADVQCANFKFVNILMPDADTHICSDHADAPEQSGKAVVFAKISQHQCHVIA